MTRGRACDGGSPPGAVAEERQHLVAHDADDLLRRRQALEDLLVDRPVADAIDERLDDLEVDVRLEQRHPDFAQRGLDGLLGEAGLTAQRPENVLQAVLSESNMDDLRRRCAGRRSTLERPNRLRRKRLS